MVTFDIDKIRKMGRNDKCWCGSELKFKRCHRDRERQKPISVGGLMDHDNSLSEIKNCYAPPELHLECSKIIKAHTISKSSGLTEIADSTNHVLGLKTNLGNLDRNDGKLKLEKIGINKASTFTGFCSKHDKDLFACFEDKPFIATKEQCIALTYRSVAKEIYGQEGLLSNAIFMRDMDKGSPLIHQIRFQNFIQQYELGIRESINKLTIVKKNLDSAILKRAHKPYSFLIIKFSSPIPIVVSSMIEPTHDFKGNLIQNLTDLRLNSAHIVLNAFSNNQKGFVVLSWLKEEKTIEKFVKSLLDKDKEYIFSSLINLFLSSSENSYISPEWWNSLNNAQKKKIESLLPMGADPLMDIPSNILVVDKVHFLGWVAEKIYRI